jgi:hypothetical protein
MKATAVSYWYLISNLSICKIITKPIPTLLFDAFGDGYASSKDNGSILLSAGHQYNRCLIDDHSTHLLGRNTLVVGASIPTKQSIVAVADHNTLQLNNFNDHIPTGLEHSGFQA